MISRPDWTQATVSKPIDLSRNVHYDSILQKSIQKHLLDSCFTNYPNQYDLYLAISDYYKIPINQLTIGYGATEVLERCIKALPVKHLHIVVPAFEMVEIYCQLYDIPFSIITLEDLDQLSDGDTLYIANPNGNDGTATDISAYLNKFKLVIVDEVYSDFYDSYSVLSKNFSNVIVVKSFSKSLGLAGFRTGFAVAIEDCTSVLQLYRSNFVMCTFSSVIIPKVITLTSEVVRRMLETKKYLEDRYDCVDSKANYVLFKQTNKYTDTFGHKKVNGLYRSALTDMETLCQYQIA